MATGRGTPPKIPTPPRIWLKTAKAPRPRAASVEELANAAPGSRTTVNRATAARDFMVSSSCYGNFDAGHVDGIRPATGPGPYIKEGFMARGRAATAALAVMLLAAAAWAQTASVGDIL